MAVVLRKWSKWFYPSRAVSAFGTGLGFGLLIRTVTRGRHLLCSDNPSAAITKVSSRTLCNFFCLAIVHRSSFGKQTPF